MPSVQGSRIAMINVAVNDLERSRRFYEELLNVEFAEERHGAAQRPKREPHRPLPNLIGGGLTLDKLSLGTVPAYSANRIPNGASSFR
jgi:catechol 2,3-dioxygenase-like lactoylglutathione lyase family enzyme